MFEQNVINGPGTGTFTQHTLEILIMLLGAFLLGLWLGWILWSKYKQAADKLALDNQSLGAAAETLRLELAATRNSLANAENDLSSTQFQAEQLARQNAQLRDELAQLQSTFDGTKSRNRQLETELGLSFDADHHVPATDIPLEIELPGEDDASDIFDAAPETESDAETHTPADHETTDEAPEEIAETVPVVIAAAADDHEPGLAGMAPTDETAEKTEAFTIADAEAPEQVEEQQDETPAEQPEAEETPKTILTPPVTINFTPVAEPHIESQPVAALAIEPDDLTVVEGIGPKIQELLYQYGIRTYQQLAETEVDRLKEILSSAGPQLAMHDPGTWPAQANLAANNQWDNLKSIQGFLKGGKRPD